MPRISDTFSKYFDLSVGCDAVHTELAQRLRYEVYCREFGFERDEDCPGGLETDPYDRQADHCLIRHRPSGEIAGCLRLVHLQTPGGMVDLPIQIHAAAALVGTPIDPSTTPASSRCEISRIAVSAKFRRRAFEQEGPLGNGESAAMDAPDARSFPMLAVALFMASRLMVLHRGTPHVFAMMEPRLARMLARAGLDFRRLGPVIEYHGQRAAYYIHGTPEAHHATLSALGDELAGLFQVVEAQLRPQLSASAEAAQST